MVSLTRHAVAGALGLSIFFLSTSSVLAQRASDGLILAYSFDEGMGDTVGDVSGFGTSHDLTIQDTANVAWGSDPVLGGFLTISSPTIITNLVPPQKIYDTVVPAGELTVEAWIAPNNNTQTGPARIFNISTPVLADSPTNRNFQIGQDAGVHIQARLRTESSTANGQPFQQTNASGDVITTPDELLHVVYTRDPSGLATIYVNGVERSDPANTQLGALTWDTSYVLALAHEHQDPANTSRAYLGNYYGIAMYDRALSQAEVLGNFSAGPALIPEPSSWLLLTIGTAGFMYIKRRRRPKVA